MFNLINKAFKLVIQAGGADPGSALAQQAQQTIIYWVGIGLGILAIVAAAGCAIGMILVGIKMMSPDASPERKQQLKRDFIFIFVGFCIAVIASPIFITLQTIVATATGANS